MGTLHCKKHHPSDEMLNRGPYTLWSLKIPGCPSKRVGVQPWHPGQISPLVSDHHGLLTIPLHWLASSLCLLSTNKLVRSGALWLPSHHSGECCTLVMVEEILPFNVKCFEYPEKCYIKVTNYYYLYFYLFCKTAAWKQDNIGGHATILGFAFTSCSNA